MSYFEMFSTINVFYLILFFINGAGNRAGAWLNLSQN